MKPRCGSCSFFKSHKPVTPGAGGNSECLRTPGYYKSGVMVACVYYAKKGKKVAKKKTPLCTNCDAPFGKDGEYTLPNLEGKVCFKCYENLCDSPIYLVNNRDKKCGRCDGPLGDHTKAVEGYSRLLCAKCGGETAKVETVVETPTPIHECYLLIKSHNTPTLPSQYVYRFKTKEEALTYIAHYGFMSSSTLLRITSERPINVEDLVLKVDYTVVNTRKVENRE